jgi:uncharacterized protein YbjT (DUF2867 family)
MSKPTILVTGATGKTGATVVVQLRARDARVRALVRGPGPRVDRLQALGAEVVIGDLFDPGQVERALRGVTRLYFCPPWHPHMLQSAVVVAAAAQQARVELIVGLSQWLASPSHPSLASRQSWLVDRLFDMVPGAAHVTVNPGFFADNYLALLGMAAQFGILPMPLGAGRNAPPSNEDIARVVAGALLDPDRHAGHTYRPTGPRLLSADDIARIMGEVLGRRVRHVEMPLLMFMKALRVLGPRLGIDAFQQSGLRHYIAEHQRGAFEVGAPTDHVRLVAGVEAEDFATIARRYLGRPEVQRTPANFLRSFRDLMLVAFTPANRLDRFERLQQHPVVARPELAVASERWAREHGIRGLQPSGGLVTNAS